jgi:hypothetical protein
MYKRFVAAQLKTALKDTRVVLLDKEKNEVDIVIEDADRRVVGIEVKAAATATAADFKGLAKLQQACGKRFALGMVLYDHHQMVPFSEKLFAVPIAALWG